MGRFLRRIYERFIRIRGNPREIALGFALGLLIGFTPTMGIQIVLAVFLAALLRWNKIAAAIGVQITNPLTAPFIYSLTYLIGAKIIGLQKTFTWTDAFDLNRIVDMIEKAPGIFGALTVGGIIIGAPVAAAAYFLSYNAIDSYQKKLKEKLLRQKERLKQKIRTRKANRKKKKKMRKARNLT